MAGKKITKQMVRSDAVLTDCDARQFSSAALPPTAGFELRTPPVGSIIVVIVLAARPRSPNRQFAFSIVYDVRRKPLAATTPARRHSGYPNSVDGFAPFRIYQLTAFRNFTSEVRASLDR
jgi:hypothetical protein